MKYLSVVLLIVVSFLVYTNKDFLSKNSANNLANVSNFDLKDYTEPEQDIAKKSINVTFSTSTDNVSRKKSSAFYNSKWIHYINNKPYVYYDENYSEGTYLNYYFSDWKNMQNYGFFLGWSRPTSVNFSGCGYAGRDGTMGSGCSLWLYRNSETVSKYQSCAKPFPEHVYFKDINTLERKMVQFANNKGDSSLKVKAKGEVGALVVLYGGKGKGACVKFVDQDGPGEIVFQPEIINNFFNLYNGKDVKQIFHYHTHDYNSGKYFTDDGYENYLIKQGNKKMIYIPSLTDLFGLSFGFNSKIWGKAFSIKNINSITGKVISPDGTGYIYDLPASDKNAIILGKGEVDEQASIDAFNKGLEWSIKKNKRENPNNEDVLSGYSSMLKHYQKAYSAKFSKYIVN